MSDGVTLASILGSEVSIQWYEAVAVVREVADRLVSAASDRAVPELQQIHLSAEGHLDVAGVTPTDEPVRRMGQLLQALLAHAEVPVQLRLVVTQATATAPPYHSVRELSDALGFFERPERSMVLQALASRVTSAALSMHEDRAMTLDSVAPLPDTSQREEKPKKSVEQLRRRSQAWRFAVVAVIVLAAAGGAAWYARSRGVGPKNKAEATDLANRASDAVGTAIVHGASAITETLGLGRIVPAKDLDPPAPPEPPPTPQVKTPQSKRPEPPAAPSQVPGIVAFDLEPVPPSAESGGPAARPEVTETTAFASPEVRRDEDNTIYSANSGAVVPPVGIRPKLARQLPPDFDTTRLGRIELIIGANGLVESAKLLGPPRTVNDGLFLSVAKAWLFQPAFKNGVPVRYRKTIWVASP